MHCDIAFLCLLVRLFFMAVLCFARLRDILSVEGETSLLLSS